jgi:uncharacterized phage infection (PIP) family protein YhgE
VRSLAQRSAAAAKEIKALIGDSVEKVDAGAKLVDQAGLTMNEIVSSVRHVTDIISEIAAASHEQTAGIEQINQSIIQMDDVTQQNAALVEQAASAATSMQEQARNLSQVVSVFKLAHGDFSVAAPIVHSVAPVVAPAAKSVAVVPKKAPARAELPPARKAGTDQADWEEF